MKGDKRLTTYHSPEWMMLVETGWVTMTVEDGTALMIYQPTKLGCR